MKAIGIDIGTTSICLVLYDKESDCVLESINIENCFLQGGYWQDPERIVSDIKKNLDTLLRMGEDVAVIGISSQMHGILYIDKNGKAVSPYYTWKETCGKEAAKLLYEKTGYPMYTGYGTVTHFVMQEKESIPEMATGFVNIGDYLVMRLCGLNRIKTDCSIAASFGGFQIEQNKFDKEKLLSAGVDISYYPEVEKYGKEAGKYGGVSVMSAVGDNQASFYAAVGNEEGVISINVGTGAQVSVWDYALEPVSESEVRPAITEGYLYVQASVNGGKVYEKLADFFREVIRSFTGQDIDVYEKMEYLGRERNETDLTVTPALYGGRGKQQGVGSMDNITAENFHPADLIRAYVAGMAEELYRAYVRLPLKLRDGRRKIIASGNGIRKNRLLVHEIEKRFGLPVGFVKWEEEAAVGAALMAIEKYE